MSDNYPAALLFALAHHDTRICFAFDLTSNRLVYANPAFESFFPVPVAMATPEIFLAMVHPQDLDYLKETYRGLGPGQFKSDIEFRMLLPDKKEYALRLSLFLGDMQNSERVLTGYLEDISGYKAHINKLNEFSNKKNAVLNILSHDLASPFSSIQSLSSLLSQGNKGPGKQGDQQISFFDRND